MSKLTDLARKKIKEEEQKEKYSSFVFDESKIQKPGDFFFLKLSPDVAGIGVCHPKEKEVYDKKGQFLHTEQVFVPVIIDSNHELHEVSPSFEREHKIRFYSLPDETALPRRWSADNIKAYLEEKTSEVNGFQLFKKIKDIYRRFMYFHNDNWHNIHALWDMSTYFYLLFKYFPIMELRGISGSAKTKIMTISRLFSFNPTQELTNPSESTLFREIGKTKYIDEAEKIFSFNPKTNKLEPDTRAEVINSGYKYTGCVPRQDRIDNRFKTIYFKTYSPNMIASINGLHGATEERAIVHITTKAPKEDSRMSLEPDENNPEYQAIRNELYVYLLNNWKEIERTYQELEIETIMKDRDLWLWKPLLALARNLDDDLYLGIKEFAETLTDIKKLDALPEESLLAHSLKIMSNLLEDNPNEPVLVKNIKAGLSDERKISNKSLSNMLDKVGLREFRKHTMYGSAYLISHQEFIQIIESQYPGFFSSYSSYSSEPIIKEENMMTKNDEYNK